MRTNRWTPSSSNPPPATPASPVGDWGGSIENCMDGCLGSATLSLTAEGQFTFGDGYSEATYNGAYQSVASQTYLLAEGGGQKGVLITDGSATYGGLLDQFDGLQAGVLQKGASGPVGTYALSDLTGSWAGAGFVPDNSFGVVTAFTAAVTFTASNCGSPCETYHWTDTAGLAQDDALTNVDATYGGGYESSAETFSDIFWFLSPDRKFLGAILCTTYPNNPSDCRVEGLTKQ